MVMKTLEKLWETKSSATEKLKAVMQISIISDETSASADAS